MEDLTFLIFLIVCFVVMAVALVVMTVSFLSKKSREKLKSLSIKELEKKLKSGRNTLIIGSVFLLIYCFLLLFSKMDFNIGLLFQILFLVYLGLLVFFTYRSILKEKEEKQEEEATEHKPVRMRKFPIWLIILIAVTVPIVMYLVIMDDIFIKDIIVILIAVFAGISFALLLDKILNKIPLKTRQKKLTDNNKQEEINTKP
jgi:Na+/H+ antiporter NhaC